MKKVNVISAAILLSGMLLGVACSKEDTLSVSAGRLEFTAYDTAERSVEVTSNTSWVCDASGDWISYRKSDNTLYVKANNHTGDSRTETITITAGKADPIVVGVRVVNRTTGQANYSMSLANDYANLKLVLTGASASSRQDSPGLARPETRGASAAAAVTAKDPEGYTIGVDHTSGTIFLE